MSASEYGSVEHALAVLAEEAAYYRQHLNYNFTGKLSKFEKFDPEKHALFTCSYDHKNSVERVFEAATSQAKKRNVLVLGDSVGRDTLSALRISYPYVNFIMLHQSCCPPAHFRNPKRDAGCFEGLQAMLENLQKVMTISGIIMTYRYRPKDWKHVEPTLPIVRAMCKNVVLMGVCPVFSKPLPDHIAEIGHVPTHILRDDPAMIPWSYDELSTQAKEMAFGYGVPFIDTHSFYLSDDKYRLWVDGDFNKPFYWDEIHLTRHSLPLFAGYLRQKTELSFLVSLNRQGRLLRLWDAAKRRVGIGAEVRHAA